MNLLSCLTLLVAVPAHAEFVSIGVQDEAGNPTPVRMEIIDSKGKGHVPAAALAVQFKCRSEPVPNEAPGCITGFSVSNFIDNPHTGTRQFYIAGPFDIDLPPGRYALAAYKGIEYSVERVNFEVTPFARDLVSVRMTRWAKLAAKGWFSADDHLHIERLSPADDAYVATLIEAEDINVANLLQLGNQQSFDMATQFAFGDRGTYSSGDTLILAGQENPRTHLFGHSMILGADEPIDLRDSYSVYDNFFKVAQKLGGLNGYAHWGLGAAENGLAIDAPRKLLSFIEVLQFEYPHYDIWYQLLNLGIPMAPTAGTDFPCGPWSVPGRERFYTRVEGKLTRQSWLEGVRRGRTFVTNGPLLEFEIDGAQIGDQLSLKRAKNVVIRGKVSFDPSRDKIDQVVLVRNGISTPLVTKQTAPGVLEIEAKHWLSESGWFALRASGTKIGEAALVGQGHSDFEYDIAGSFGGGVSMKQREAFVRETKVRPSEAHTGAIYVDLSGAKGISRQPRSQVIAVNWLTRLKLLEVMLQDENIANLPLKFGALPNSDGVDLDDLLRNRRQLLGLIDYAKKYFHALVDERGVTGPTEGR